jgi:uncharacterized protein YkwD
VSRTRLVHYGRVAVVLSLGIPAFTLGLDRLSLAAPDNGRLAAEAVLGTIHTPAPSPTPPPATPAPPPASASAPRPTVAPIRPAPVRSPAVASELASVDVCPGQLDPAQTAGTLVCLSSYARKFHGLPPVTGQSQLQAAAAAKVGDMLACGYSHTACGRPGNHWVEMKGYAGSCSGENIALGQKTPRAVFEAWMKSAGHRANILNPRYNGLGAASAPGSGGLHWVMVLGGCG